MPLFFYITLKNILRNLLEEKMIRLATVFSGIGAIEHALDCMGLKHEIVFACDNGDVDILTKKVKISFDDIRNELSELQGSIDEIHSNDDINDVYKNQLKSMLSESDTIQGSRKKEYLSFQETINNGSENQQKLIEMQLILKLFNDLKKDERIGDFKEVAILYSFLEANNGKKTIRKIQDLSQRASQLHEKINYMKTQNKLESMGDDWKARKSYVDSLYKELESRNKVKKSYLANYNLSNDDFHWNVAFLNGKQYTGQVDLFVGGSPCQSFSLVGKQRGLDDTRGTLFYEYARLIDEIKPKVFIYENVKALTSHDKGKTWKKMRQGDYNLPCLSPPEEEQKPVGIWGQRHLRYIKEHKRAFYTNLLTSCKLNSYLVRTAKGGKSDGMGW